MNFYMGEAVIPTLENYWVTYSPKKIMGIVEKYLGPYKGSRIDAENILGKWIYYLGKKSFPNTPAGRFSASGKIAQDIAAQGGGKYNSEAVYNVIQTANAYLRKDLKLPAADRGELTALQKLKKKAAGIIEETAARTEELNPLDTLNPFRGKFIAAAKWGGLGVLGLVVAGAGYKVYKTFSKG